jgi:hypothetical protein
MNLRGSANLLRARRTRTVLTEDLARAPRRHHSLALMEDPT